MFKVSVIVPVYNTEKYLSKCLDSLVNQTLDDIEILIINDGSPDNSQVIINDYANKYKDKIRFIEKENGGIGTVRNLGIKEVKGEYFAFLDSDDYVDEDYYELMYQEAKKNSANIISSDFVMEYDKKSKSFIEKRYEDNKSFITNLHAVLWNRLYKTEFIRSLDFNFIGLKRYEDANYLYKLASHLKENDFNHLDISKIHYVQRAQSWMHSYNDKVLDSLKMVDDVIKYYKDKNIYDDYKEELEYVAIRNCFGQPFRTAVKIKDKKIRKDILNKMYDKAFNEYPNYKKNKYIKNDSKKIFYLTINKFTFKIYSFIFRIMPMY